MTWEPPSRNSKPGNPSEEDADAVATAKAGTDQMSMIYRDIWIPFFAQLSEQMATAGLSDELRDTVIGDLHRKFILMGEERR